MRGWVEIEKGEKPKLKLRGYALSALWSSIWNENAME